MIKKLVFWSAVVGGGLFLVNSVWHGSVHTAFKRARTAVERKISPEFELARIRDQIASLTPDMHKNISRIAEEMVAVERLEKRTVALQDKLGTTKVELAALTGAIENGTKRVSINGRELSTSQIATQVKDKLRSCRLLEKELDNATKMLEAKKSGVEAARLQLAAMKQQKEEMEVLAEQYAAELKTLQLEQTRSKIKLDDSRLAEIKQSFEKLRERIQVERNRTILADEFKTNTLTTPESKTDAKNVVDEAREYLGTKDKADAVKN